MVLNKLRKKKDPVALNRRLHQMMIDMDGDKAKSLSLEEMYGHGNELIAKREPNIHVYLNQLLEEQEDSYGYVSILEKNRLKLTKQQKICT